MVVVRDRAFVGPPISVLGFAALPMVRPKKLVLGTLVPLLLVFASAFAGTPQTHEPSHEPNTEPNSELATDNLNLVSASATQIRAVLDKDPGLMVALKRLMAKEASDSGQIVVEKDLEDSSILDRLENDARFRALATRLLQRYGYLTPQLNPLSRAGQEQELMLKAQAERLAHRTDVGQESVRSEAVCERKDIGCPAETGEHPSIEKPSSPEPVGPSVPTPDQKLDVAPRSLLTAGAGISNESEPPDPKASTLWPADLTWSADVRDRTSTAANLPSASTAPRAFGSEDRIDGFGSIPPVTPEPNNKPAPYSNASLRDLKVPEPPQQVEMVNLPSPYAYLPSLYDLYVQAAPETGNLKRFGLEVFRRPVQSAGIPMDLPAGPEYVLGPGDELTIDLWGSVAQRLFRTVDREGRLSLPDAGPILAGGRTLGEVQEIAQRVLRTQYRDVSADISLGRLRTVRVYVVGDVVSPGAYDISSLSTPLNALWAAGGVTTRGSLRLVSHLRGRESVEQVDVYDLLLKGVRGNLKNLENGDTILVPPVGPQVTIDGMVRRPAIYELRGETNLAQALELAGGVLPRGGTASHRGATP